MSWGSVCTKPKLPSMKNCVYLVSICISLLIQCLIIVLCFYIC